MKKIVWKFTEGNIGVTHLDFNFKDQGETDSQFIERQAAKWKARHPLFGNAQHFVIDDKDIPEKNDSTRYKWRLSGDEKKVVVDDTVTKGA